MTRRKLLKILSVLPALGIHIPAFASKWLDKAPSTVPKRMGFAEGDMQRLLMVYIEAVGRPPACVHLPKPLWNDLVRSCGGESQLEGWLHLQWHIYGHSIPIYFSRRSSSDILFRPMAADDLAHWFDWDTRKWNGAYCRPGKEWSTLDAS